jgi:carboxyl-terminal processing protease
VLRRRFALGILLGVLFAAGWLAGRSRASTDVYAQLDLFLEVLRAVQTSYVDEVDARTVMQGGLRGLVRGLDPHSRYLDPLEHARYTRSLAGEVEGIGAWVDVREGFPVLVAPLQGGPAWRAGLAAGDWIVRVDSAGTRGWGVDETRASLQGTAGTTVALEIARPGEDSTRRVVLTRERIDVKAVPYAFVAAPGVGYLRLAVFHERAAAETRAAADSLRRVGARALVLDLRGNPGGLVEQAVGVASVFLPAGTAVVSVEGRDASVSSKQVAAGDAPPLPWPLVVLVDEGTASAAEIVAGAFQDLDRAVVLGRTTFGKGSVQNLYPLRARGGAVQLTTAYYHTPSGRGLHRLTREALDDEDAEAGSEAPAAPDDSTRYRTAGGRMVRAGGGVTPDVVVAADSVRAATDRVPLDALSAQRTLASDPMLQRALALLAGARDPRAVFTAAGIALPAGGVGAR